MDHQVHSPGLMDEILKLYRMKHKINNYSRAIHQLEQDIHLLVIINIAMAQDIIMLEMICLMVRVREIKKSVQQQFMQNENRRVLILH